MRVTRGDLRVRLPAAGQRLHIEADARVLALKVGNKTYALFGPTGVKWEPVSPTEWIARLPAGAGYLSVAALPDDKAETLALFTRHAYAFIKQTRVEWRYDEAASQVETTFKATTQVMEGPGQRAAAGPVPAPVVQERLGRRQARGQLRHRARQAAPAGRVVQDHLPRTTASCRTGPASPHRRAWPS
jgi:hypothetical protein